MGDPIEARLNEETARQPAIEQLQKQISLCKSFLSNYDDCYAHITEDERDVLRTEVSKTESWLQTELNKQSKLPKHDNPVLTADAIGKTRATLFKCSSPIMTKPKPAPPAAPQPAAEEKKEKEPAQVDYCDCQHTPTHHHFVSCAVMSTHLLTRILIFRFRPSPQRPLRSIRPRLGTRTRAATRARTAPRTRKAAKARRRTRPAPPPPREPPLSTCLPPRAPAWVVQKIAPIFNSPL